MVYLTRSALPPGDVTKLKAEVDSANAQIQQMHEDLQAWEEAVSARDAELRNLQVRLCYILQLCNFSTPHERLLTENRKWFEVG